MQVILLQDLYKHGVAGEVVKVADGFARNYLIPRKMAVKATHSALAETEAIRKNVEARRAQYDNMLNDLARQIDGVELIFGRRAASTGKLFGSVTTQEIAEALDEKAGVDLNRRRISQQGLREVGTHRVAVRLGNEISPELIITIVPEELHTDFLDAREKGINLSAEDILEENFDFKKLFKDSEEAADATEAEDVVEEVEETVAEVVEEPVEEAASKETTDDEAADE